MNRAVDKKDFLNKFASSSINARGKSTTLVKSVIAALALHAFTVSIPSIAHEMDSATLTSKSVDSKAPSGPVSSQYKIGEQPKEIDFEGFKELSESKRSGLYKHPFNENETLMIFMLGDDKPMDRIASDYKMLKGEDLPDIAVKLINQSQEFNNIIDGSRVVSGLNLSCFVNTPLDPSVNFIFLDTVNSMNYKNSVKKNDPNKNLLSFYFVAMHEIAHTLPYQKMDFFDLLKSKFVSADGSDAENSADFVSTMYVSKSLKEENYGDDEIIEFLEETRDMRVRMSKDTAKAGVENYYYGQTSISVAIKMMEENPEFVENINIDELKQMGNTLQDYSLTHDITMDYKESTAQYSYNIENLTEALEQLQQVAINDPENFKSSATENINNLIAHNQKHSWKIDSRLNAASDASKEMIDRGRELSEMSSDEVSILAREIVLKIKTGHSSPHLMERSTETNELVSQIKSFPAFEREILAKFKEQGLWAPRSIVEPDFKMGALVVDNLKKLDTEVLEIVLDNSVKAHSVVLDPKKRKVTDLVSASSKEILEKAKEFGFDLNESFETGRIDLFFKDEEKSTFTLNMELDSVTPEFFEHSVRLLKDERLCNIATLDEQCSTQLSGNELNRNYSSYNENEIVIREIDYLQTSEIKQEEKSAHINNETIEYDTPLRSNKR